MNNKHQIMRYFKFLGNILAIFSVAFIIYRLYEMDFDWGAYDKNYQTYIILFFLSFMAVFNNFINGYAWKKYVDFFDGTRYDTFDLVNVYLRANIEKYMPGNIVQYAGRNLLAKCYGINQKSVAAASVLELVWICVSAVIFSVMLSLQNVRVVIEQLWSNPAVRKSVIILFGAGIAILLVGVVILKSTKYWRRACSYINKTFVLLISRTFVLYILNFLISGLLLSCIFGLVLHCEMDFIDIASTNILSWLAGYVVPGSPGGIGVREAVLIILLGSVYPKEIVVLAAVLMRICSIAGDFFSYFLALCLDHFRKKGRTRDVL